MGVIGIYTTNRCNLECKYCFAEQKKNDLDLEKAYEFIKYYTSKIHEKNTIIVTGGEALLVPGLKSLLNKLSKDFNDIGVLTNGVYLTDEWLEYFQEKNITIHISIDSLTPKYHEKYRGHFKETKEAADKMTNYRSEKKPIICMTLSYENIPELYRMINYAKKNNFLMDLNLLSLDSSKKLSWSNASNQQVQLGIKAIDDWIDFSHRDVKGKLMKRLLREQTYSLDVCYNRTHSIIIHSNGDIYPCFINKKRYFGNIYSDNYDEIINKKLNLDRCMHSDKCFSMACMGMYY